MPWFTFAFRWYCEIVMLQYLQISLSGGGYTVYEYCLHHSKLESGRKHTVSLLYILSPKTKSLRLYASYYALNNFYVPLPLYRMFGHINTGSCRIAMQNRASAWMGTSLCEAKACCQACSAAPDSVGNTGCNGFVGAISRVGEANQII